MAVDLNINELQKGLVNRKRCYSSLYFLIQNKEYITHLDCIERGKVINNNGFFKVEIAEPRPVYEMFWGEYSKGFIFDEERFINLYNRYVLPYCRENGLHVDSFPIRLNVFLSIVNLMPQAYDFDSIFYALLHWDLQADQEEVLPHLLMGYAKEDSFELEKDVIDSVLSRFSNKVKEYKEGKLGVINLLLGEYIKASKNKSFDKKLALEAIKEYLD